MNRLFYLFLMISLAIFAGCNTAEVETNTALVYPETAKVDTVDHYFGHQVSDPYRWLEDDNSQETASWVTAQNEVTFDYLEQIPFREQIKSRLEELWDYEKIYAPTKHGDFYYYYRNNGLQNQNVLFRRSEDGEEEVFLDPNNFSDDGTVSMAQTSFTTDGSMLAFMISEGGSDWRKAVVMKTTDQEIVGDTLVDIKFSGIAWKGNDGFYYSSYDKPKDGSVLSGKTQRHKLYYHQLGTPQSEDKLIYGGDKQPRRYIGAYTTEDEGYLVITAAESTSGNELIIMDLRQASPEFRTIVDNFDQNHYVVANEDSRLLIHTDLEAPNNRLVEVDAQNPTPDNWTDLIPETENVLSTTVVGGKIFAEYMIDAKSSIQQFDLQGNLEKEVPLPGIGTVYGFNGKMDDEEVYYTFTSFTHPSTIYKYTLASGSSELYQQPEIDFDPDLYVTKQIFYESKDGTKIPMFIVHKKDLELNGKTPTYLYAYGGFNISLTPGFSISRLVWLENGGIYAQPNLRGGGEYGEKWHLAGTKMNKQNVFDDFIGAGEYLIAEGYTTSDYLAIAGGSNGGLLVGATMTQRPDLARVAFPAVGVMDMLRYHTFTAGAGWAFDYGTSEDSEEMFQYLYKYSPVHALKTGTDYPATMVTTADHDDRVVPAHSFKFAATLQQHHVGDAPVIIRIETDAGHGAGTPTSKRIEQAADYYAFAWYNMNWVPDLAGPEM